MAVLINESYRSYPRLSRYAAFPYYYNTRDKRYWYGLTGYLNSNTKYNNYKVKPGDTWDKIALESYNDAAKYWVLLDFNRHLDAFSEPQVGSIIKIPVISNITF